MNSPDLKGELHQYLRGARETLVWKMDGLGEYDIRRPLTPTGTNLLGLIKHSAGTEVLYFGEVFDRTPNFLVPWLSESAEPGADMWATPDETRAFIVDLYRSAWEFADATIDELRLDSPGRVRWWGEAPVTLGHVLIHVVSETQRHAGHADILRESIDGAAGLLPGHDNLRFNAPADWQYLHERIEEAARRVR